MSTAVTPEQLEEIRERASAATEGPWTLAYAVDDATNPEPTADKAGFMASALNDKTSPLWLITNSEVIPAVTGDGPRAHANAEFIAAAREDVPALLAEVDRLREQLANAESWTTVFPCEISYEPPYDFRSCATHGRTFPLDGDCDHAGLSEIDWMQKRETEQRFRAIMAEESITRVETLAAYWETLADGDRHYAARIRSALAGTP